MNLITEKEYNECSENDIVIEGNGISDEEELIVNIDRFDEAVIWGTDWTTETIASQLIKGNIDLDPAFQRRDAWTDREKSRFIESLFLGLPVPPIILAESKDRKNSFIVIDGKQRLLSIMRFYSELSEKDFKERGLQEKDVFKQLKLRGLDLLTNFNNKTKNEIEEIDNNALANFENQVIRTIVIKNWPEESFLYAVFLRLNTGSKKLSPQELRQALSPGGVLDYLDDATSNSDAIMKMLNRKDPDPRMKDIELALRYLAFRLFSNNYRGNLKIFLDETCKLINDKWDEVSTDIENKFIELETAIIFLTELFAPDMAFARYNNGASSGRFNKALFDPLSFYFSFEEVRNRISDCSDEFIKSFKELCDDPEFIYSISDTTKEIHRVEIRFRRVLDLLMEMPSIKGKEVALPKLTIKDGQILVVEAIS